MPLWLQIIVGVVTPLIAAMGALVAFQQWKLGQRTLIHHLFDRRWAVYAAVHDVLVTHTSGDDEAQSSSWLEFARRKVDAEFLFPAAVVSFIQEANDAVDAARAADRATRKGAQDRDSLLMAQHRYTETVADLRALQKRLPNVFHSSLDLTQ